MKTLFDRVRLERDGNKFFFCFENGAKEEVSTTDALQWEISRKLNILISMLEDK